MLAEFLKAFHSGASPLLLLGVVLLVGLTCGAIAKKFLHLPSVTGQIFGGILLGPVFHVIDHHGTDSLAPVTTLALGLIAVAIGSHLELRRLSGAGRRLRWLIACECLVTPAIVFGTMLLMPGVPWVFALLLSALAISTAPATIIALVRETCSKGVFVRTLVAAVALNNVACIMVFEVVRVLVDDELSTEGSFGILGEVADAFGQLGLSAIIGGGVALLLTYLTKHVARRDLAASMSLVAVLVVSGLAAFASASTLLACLFFGFVLANVAPEQEHVGHQVFEDFESSYHAIFFTVAGLHLVFGSALGALLIAGVMVAARLVGKVISVQIAMRLADSTLRLRNYLGLALVPQAGVAVGLILVVQGDPAFAELSDLFLAVGLTSVTLNELIGPLLTRYALQRSGDYKNDRARVIDFLGEECIVTNFEAESMADALPKLTDLLCRRNRLSLDREAFTASLLERKSKISACLGGGLAITQGVLEGGSEIKGVLALSRQGLDFKTPDGKPVHCIVLIAVPVSQMERRLEVIAAFAKAITADGLHGKDAEDLHGMELFLSRSPAHAWEVLHAQHPDHFNYFLSA